MNEDSSLIIALSFHRRCLIILIPQNNVTMFMFSVELLSKIFSPLKMKVESSVSCKCNLITVKLLSSLSSCRII